MASGLMIISSISFVSAGEPPAPPAKDDYKGNFSQFLMDGLANLRSDARSRLFLYTQ